MNISERKEKILELLSKKGKVKVSELSKLFDTSNITIRSDLADLEDKGLLFRVHGGAVNSYKSYCDMDLKQRLDTNHRAKLLIAKQAVKNLKEHDTVMLNSGSTTLLVFRSLPPQLHLNIVTNCITIALEASGNPNYNVVLLGGLVNAKYQFVYGDDAVSQLKKYHANKLFLSVDGVTTDGSLTTYYDREAEIAKLMLSQSASKIIVADSAKIGKTAFVNIVNSANDCTLITDSANLDSKSVSSLKKNLGKLVVVKD